MQGLLVLGACDYARPPDSVVGDPDVVAISAVLVAGETAAGIVVAYPYRTQADSVPQMEATLHGPRWSATFSRDPDLRSCTEVERELWAGSVACYSAALPDPIQSERGYALEGTVAGRAFSGAMVVPPAPVLLDPWDTVEVALPGDDETIEVPIGFGVDSTVGTLIPYASDIIRIRDDGTEEAVNTLNPWGRALNHVDPKLDTLLLGFHLPRKQTVRLLGLGWNYANFLEMRGRFVVPEPWPSTGIIGERVYGYFVGAAWSRSTVRIIARLPG